MKYLSLLLITLMTWANAQNQRFTYQYHFAGNVAQLDNFYTENMALDVTEDGSEFYSVDKIKSDSLKSVEREKQRRSGQFKMMEEDDRSKIDYKVSKSYPDYDIKLTTYLDRDTYIVKDDRIINWQIISETKKIGEWECQKATADFAGRKWNAWFTMEIPIPDGPYKFRGLPGLIVSISSEDKTHQYQLISVRRLNLLDQLNGDQNSNLSRFRRQPMEVTSEQFVKQQKKFYADPTAEIRQRFSSRKLGNGSPRPPRMKNSNGERMTDKDILKMIEERIEKEKQENSNPVELDMLN